MKHTLTIGWLYPDLMSIYGDRGNIIALTRRAWWRNMSIMVKPIGIDSSVSELRNSDLLFMGGAQDRQQTIVAKDLEKKKKVLAELIEEGIPGLYICGGFQFLGNYYKEADGTVIDQLGVLDVYTESPGGDRLIGNIAVDAGQTLGVGTILVGFENHGGRTRLGESVRPLGKVIKGYGSNAEDGTEGAVYKNSIGTYLHGPILPKNPRLADFLLEKALLQKYKEPVELPTLDDTLANLAHDTILKRMK